MKPESVFKWVVALALAVGCVVGQAETAAPESFDVAFQRHLTAVRKWGPHTSLKDVVLGVPAALAFVEANASASNHTAQVAELRGRILETLSRGRDYRTGVPTAEALLAGERTDWFVRCRAAEYLAMGLVDTKKDYAAADALYAKLLDVELSRVNNVWAIARLVGCRAYLHVLCDDKEGALRLIDADFARVKGDKGFRERLRGALDEESAKVYEEFFDYRGEVDHFIKVGRKDLAFRVFNQSKLSDEPLARRLAREILTDKASPAGLCTQAWTWLFSRDEAFCRANVGRCLDKSPASTNAFVGSLSTRLTAANISSVYGTATPAYYRNPDTTVKFWEYLLPCVKAAGLALDYRCAKYACAAYAELGIRAKAIDAAREGLALAKRIKPAEAYELKLMIAILEAKGSVDEIAAQVKAAVENLSLDCPESERTKRFEHAASVAIVLKDDVLARGVDRYYRTNVRVRLEKKCYTVRFSDRPISGVGDWVDGPVAAEESDFDRVYGGKGMAFMTTDVATGDRGRAVRGGEKVRKHPTTLRVLADEWGIHFAYTFHDRRARQFESGELDCGSFESYFAPGDGQPYLCFLSYPKKDTNLHLANMAYDAPGHRRVNATDTMRYRCGTAFTDEAVITYSAFSWDNFADHLPVDGGEWDFESIFWGPVPSAWNGTESIHGRSTWGKLRFELGEAARLKILRAQLFKAVSQYRREKLPRQALRDSVQEGVFSHWSDDEVGDPAFYEKCLKPLLAELDPVAEKVKVGISDADVKAITENYLSRFREIRFEVARLRTRYLEEALQ